MDFELETCGFDYPDDFDQKLISEFAIRFASTRRLKPHKDEEILALAHLGKRQSGGLVFVPNIACALLFANDPRLRFPGCFIRFCGLTVTRKVAVKKSTQ